MGSIVIGGFYVNLIWSQIMSEESTFLLNNWSEFRWENINKVLFLRFLHIIIVVSDIGFQMKMYSVQYSNKSSTGKEVEHLFCAKQSASECCMCSSVAGWKHFIHFHEDFSVITSLQTKNPSMDMKNAFIHRIMIIIQQLSPIYL